MRLALWIALVAAAPSPEVLHLYSALHNPNEIQAYTQAFTADTGIPVRWVRLSSGEVLTRLRAERHRPQASVWLGGPSLEYMTAADEGLLLPHEPTTLTRFPPHGRDASFRWSGAYLGAIGFASNPTLLARRGVPPPTSWAELLRPELRGELAMAYPYTSGTSYTILASVAQLMGEAEALAYFRAFDANVHHYTRSGSACIVQAGLGEIGVCVAFAHDVVNAKRQKGYPVVLTFPKEGTGYEVGGVAVVAGAPELEPARRFVDWILSPRAQELMRAWNRLPIRDDLPAPASSEPAAPSLLDVELIDFDPGRAADRRRELIEAWREVTGQ